MVFHIQYYIEIAFGHTFVVALTLGRTRSAGYKQLGTCNLMSLHSL